MKLYFHKKSHVYQANFTNAGRGINNKGNGSFTQGTFNNSNDHVDGNNGRGCGGRNGGQNGRDRSNVQCQFCLMIVHVASICYILMNLLGGGENNKKSQNSGGKGQHSTYVAISNSKGNGNN